MQCNGMKLTHMNRSLMKLMYGLHLHQFHDGSIHLRQLHAVALHCLLFLLTYRRIAVTDEGLDSPKLFSYVH